MTERSRCLFLAIIYNVTKAFSEDLPTCRPMTNNSTTYFTHKKQTFQFIYQCIKCVYNSRVQNILPVVVTQGYTFFWMEHVRTCSQLW